VLMVAGVVFVIETLLRRDEGAGRVWALAFLAGILTTVCYLVWGAYPETWWAVAAGNGSFVAGTGLLWLGARRFNGRPMRWPSIVVAIVSLAACGAVVVAGPEAGDWAGAVFMFLSIAALAVAGTIESVTGEMGANRNAVGLAFVLGLQALFYIARSIVFVAYGPGRNDAARHGAGRRAARRRLPAGARRAHRACPAQRGADGRHLDTAG
jgi:hypothetical protein